MAPIAQTVATDSGAARWHFVVDNLNIHQSASLVRFVAERAGRTDALGVKGQSGILASQQSRAAFLRDPAHPIVFHDTPKHASWRNQIAIWRGILPRTLLRRGSFLSTDDLIARVLAFIAYDNRTMARPCTWIYQGKPLCDSPPSDSQRAVLVMELHPTAPPSDERKEGSIIVVIATDAPLSDRQLARLCRRGMLGIGRVGGIAGHSSGDLLLAFSNAPEVRVPRRPPMDEAGVVDPLLVTPRLYDGLLDPIFAAVIDATAEAILNALVAAETMTGRDGNTAHALPHDCLRAIMQRHGRLGDTSPDAGD